MLDLFGQLEDGEPGRMVVRLLGHRIGESNGWVYWNGLCVVFPEFIATNEILKKMMPKDDPKKIHLIMDFYSGHGAILIKDSTSDTKPVIHDSFQLSDLKLGEALDAAHEAAMLDALRDAEEATYQKLAKS